MKRDSRRDAETQRGLSSAYALGLYLRLLGWMLSRLFLAPLALFYAGLKHVAKEAHCLLSRTAQRRRVLISTREVGDAS